MLEIGLCIV